MYVYLSCSFWSVCDVDGWTPSFLHGYFAIACISDMPNPHSKQEKFQTLNSNRHSPGVHTDSTTFSRPGFGAPPVRHSRDHLAAAPAIPAPPTVSMTRSPPRLPAEEISSSPPGIKAIAEPRPFARAPLHTRRVRDSPSAPRRSPPWWRRTPPS